MNFCRMSIFVYATVTKFYTNFDYKKPHPCARKHAYTRTNTKGKRDNGDHLYVNQHFGVLNCQDPLSNSKSPAGRCRRGFGVIVLLSLHSARLARNSFVGEVLQNRDRLYVAKVEAAVSRSRGSARRKSKDFSRRDARQPSSAR